MQDEWTSPSGSRWEPVAPPAHRAVAAEPRRRSRRPVVAVLLTVLGAGVVTSGATYAHGDAPAVSTPAGSTAEVAGTGHHDGPHRHDQHGTRS